MPGEGIPHQHLGSGAGVQQAVVGGLEEALVGIEARFEELVEELAEDPATVDARLVQAMSIEQVHADPFLKIRFWKQQQEKKRLKGCLNSPFHLSQMAVSSLPYHLHSVLN